jgi:hypothetical protein
MTTVKHLQKDGFDGGGIGIIYILTDEGRKLSKIGRTTAATAVGRAISYGKAHGHRWTIFAQMTTLRVAEVETSIQARLYSKQLQTKTGAREIFKVHPTEAETVARSLILSPGDTPEAQREAIKRHVLRVRKRLSDQERFLLHRSRGDFGTIPIDIWSQYVALDALERGISIDEMVTIYEGMITRRAAELARIKAANEAAYNKANKAQGWWKRIFGPTLSIPKEQLDEKLYPDVEYYAWNAVRRRLRAEPVGQAPRYNPFEPKKLTREEMGMVDDILAQRLRRHLRSRGLIR